MTITTNLALKRMALNMFFEGQCQIIYNAVGREAFEGLRFLASLPRAGAGREKTQPFNGR